MKIEPSVIIDSREQQPLEFLNLPAVRGTLATGDYSVWGLEHLVSIERKSLPDLVACVGRERDRFKAELQRMRAFRFRLLVVEASAAEIHAGGWRSEVTPAAVSGSLAAWQVQYSLPVWLDPCRESLACFVERYLFQAARCVATEHESAIKFIDGNAGKLAELAVA